MFCSPHPCLTPPLGGSGHNFWSILDETYLAITRGYFALPRLYNLFSYGESTDFYSRTKKCPAKSALRCPECLPVIQKVAPKGARCQSQILEKQETTSCWQVYFVRYFGRINVIVAVSTFSLCPDPTKSSYETPGLAGMDLSPLKIQ